jgi:hypothetical protein
MKTIASLEGDVAVELTKRLKQEAIPFEIRTATQDNGLDYSDIMVGDGDYGRACDVAEAWDADRLAEQKKESDAVKFLSRKYLRPL